MRVKRVSLAAAVLALCAMTRLAHNPARRTEWPTYGGDLGHTRYSPLDQIVEQLQHARGRVALQDRCARPRPEYQLESTPLMVKGVLYSTAGSRRAVVALDAATVSCSGCTARTKERVRCLRRGSCRAGAGVLDRRPDQRILYVTPGYRLIALDAKTGVPVRPSDSAASSI